MKKSNIILVPTDFSDAARNATDYAVSLAKEINYEVLLFHVYNTPVMDYPDVNTVMVIDIVEFEKQAKKRVKDEAEFLEKKTGLKINYEAVNGFIADEIVMCEQRHQPAFIVMGMKEVGPLSEMLLGSTATDILLKVNAPLFIIPEKALFRKPQRVVFGNDPKLTADIEIHSSAQDLFSHFYSTLYILTVLKEPGTIDKSAVQTKLEKHFTSRFHTYHFLENEDVIEAINDFVDVNAIDLVVMMPYKHSFFERLFNKPHTKRLAFHSHIPMLSMANGNKS